MLFIKKIDKPDSEIGPISKGKPLQKQREGQELKTSDYLMNQLASSKTFNKNNKYTLQRTAMLIASEGRRSKVILSVGSSVCRTGGI